MSAAAGSAVSGPPDANAAAQWERDGQSLFLACEFKQATYAFEKALAGQPDSAVLHYWLGKSYARLAEVSSPLSARKNAHKARRSLEQAVKIDPQNGEYLLELFDFYVDSPEWFSPGEPGAEPQRRQLAASRKEYSGASWWMRRAVLWTWAAIGYPIPQP
jgi:tetratricopeptide (TPR) repeat protein